MKVLDAPSPALGREQIAYVDRLLKRLHVRREDAQDLRQDILLSAQRALPAFRQRASLETWLHRISLRAVAHYRRQRAQGQLVTLDELAQVAAPASSDAQCLEPAERVLEAALAELDERERALARLHFLQGLSVPESARALGYARQTAYDRVRRIRERIANSLYEG